MPRSEQQPSVVSGLRAFSAEIERSRGTGPRATVSGGFLGHRFAARPLHPCRSGSPDPDLFVIRRSQTTEGKHIVTMELAGDRPPRYDKKRLPLTVGRGPSHATRACERVSLAMHRSKQQTFVASGLRTFAAEIERSRGTGPRATVLGGFLHVRGGQALLGP